MRSEIKAMLAVITLAAGCADRSAGAAQGVTRSKEAPIIEQGSSGRDTTGQGGVRNLPSSFGQSFATLDEYLGHLRDHAGPIDLPWYREIKPGVYELVTSVRLERTPQTNTREQTYTREQLMRKYGFAR